MAKNPASRPGAAEPLVDPIAPAGTGEVLTRSEPAAVVEEPRVETDQAGEPRSAEIAARPASFAETLAGRPLPRRPARDVPELLPTSLPAVTRVLPSGTEIPARPAPAEAGEERVFTAKTRILRSKKLYDVGAPVPLTRMEYVAKRRVDAVEEMSFDEGIDALPAAEPAL